MGFDGESNGPQSPRENVTLSGSPNMKRNGDFRRTPMTNKFGRGASSMNLMQGEGFTQRIRRASKRSKTYIMLEKMIETAKRFQENFSSTR